MRGRRQVIFYNCGGQGHYVQECMNLTHLSCRYCTQFEYAIEDYSLLIDKMLKKGMQPTQNL